MASTLVFDIETIPDVAGIRRLYNIGDELSDNDVAEYAFQRRRASHGQDSLPLHLQRVAVIACVVRDAQQLRVFSIAAPDEGESLRQFFDEAGQGAPQGVSWNGSGFDVPVLRYRGMVHGLTAPQGWLAAGAGSPQVDLMPVLAGCSPEAVVPQDELACLMGIPCQRRLDDSAVWNAWRAGALDALRGGCETKALTTYLLLLRYQYLCGERDAASLADEEAQVRSTLENAPASHWPSFLQAWLKRSV